MVNPLDFRSESTGRKKSRSINLQNLGLGPSKEEFGVRYNGFPKKVHSLLSTQNPQGLKFRV